MKEMKSDQKIMFILMAVLIISAAAYFLSSNTTSNMQNKEDETKIIFYVGDGCPHCENVKQYIKMNQIDKKIVIEEREVYNNKQNLEMLKLSAQKCGLSSSNIGVPFLVYKGKCYIGKDQAIELFEDVLGLRK